MVDESHLNLSIHLWDQAMALPVVLGPVGMAGMYSSRGEVKAAASRGRGADPPPAGISTHMAVEITAFQTSHRWEILPDRVGQLSGAMNVIATSKRPMMFYAARTSSAWVRAALTAGNGLWRSPSIPVRVPAAMRRSSPVRR